MTPLARREAGVGRRVATLALALGAAGLAAAALAEVSARRVPLLVLMPAGLPWLLAGLWAAAAACAAATGLAAARLARPGPPAGRDAAAQLPWRVAAYVFVAGAVVHVAFLQPYRALVAHATLGLCAGVVGLLLLLAPRVAAAVPRRVRSGADLLAFGTCMTLVGGELVLAVLAQTSDSPFFAREYESIRDFTDRYRLDPAGSTPDFPVNAGGHFDTPFTGKTAGVPLAVCIGDSFSTSVVPHAWHFTTVAERALGQGEVYNMGIAGIGLQIYLHLLRTEAMPLRPDVVVVDVFVGNDLAEGLGEARDPGWLQRWLDADRLLLVLVPPRFLAAGREQPRVARPMDAEELAAAEAGAHVPARPAAPGDGRHGEALLQAFPWLVDPLKELPAYSAESFATLEWKRARAVCLPDEPPAWARIQDLLLEMRAVCGDTPLLVLIIPDEFQVEDDVWGMAQAGPDGARFDRDLPQRVLGAWLAEQGIPALDLLPVLRAVPPLEDGRRHLYHLRDTHFNARGNEAAGLALAEFLRPYLLR